LIPFFTLDSVLNRLVFNKHKPPLTVYLTGMFAKATRKPLFDYLHL